MKTLKLILLLCFLCTNISAQDSVWVGVINKYGDIQKGKAAFEKTIEALNANSKLKWKVKIFKNEKDLNIALENNEIQIIKMNPLAYALKKQNSPIRAIAIGLNKKGSPYFTSVIVTYKKSDITNLQQIKGRKMAFGSKNSTASFLIPASYLERIGVELSEIDYKFIGTQSKILLALQKGEVDAGAIVDDILNNVRPGTFKILHRSESIPGSPMIISKELPQGKVDAIVEDLRSYNRYIRRTPELRPQIDIDFKYGFSVEVNENVFDPLRLAYKKILPKIKK